MILQRAVQMSQIPTKDGYTILRPSGVERVAQLLKNGDVDEAIWFMAMEENTARMREEEFSQMMMQQTIQGQQESALATEEAKRQTAMQLAEIEIMKQREMANMELMKEQQLAKIKADANYQVQLLKGKQALEEINLEATLEAQYGNEITGRV
jgi:hypothetical protein